MRGVVSLGFLVCVWFGGFGEFGGLGVWLAWCFDGLVGWNFARSFGMHVDLGRSVGRSFCYIHIPGFQ